MKTTLENVICDRCGRLVRRDDVYRDEDDDLLCSECYHQRWLYRTIQDNC